MTPGNKRTYPMKNIDLKEKAINIGFLQKQIDTFIEATKKTSTNSQRKLKKVYITA